MVVKLWVLVRTTRNVGWSEVLFAIYGRNCEKIDASVKDLKTRH